MAKFDELWSNAATLQAVLDNVSDGVLTYSPDLVITGVNRAAVEILGFSPEFIVGRHCSEVFRCGTCEPGCGFSVALTTMHRSANSTVRIHTADGAERLAIIHTSPIQNPSGQLDGIVVTFKDVTEQIEPQNRSFVTESPRMRQILGFVRKVASSEATSILIEGESGTGKDLIAKTIHYQSMRQAQPFIAINCSAIPEQLLEAELFGYEKGSFTDAKNQKRGLIELADKGTLLLDEIGEMPLILQTKMLRVLEDQRVRRIGGVKDFSVDVRVIAVTNRNLLEAVRAGAFRQDLYYRLNVIQIYIPPLRERSEDILPLANYYISHYNHKFRRKIQGLSPDAEKLLLRHSWPGNVRELRNAIERAMILEDMNHIRVSSLPISLNRYETITSPVERIDIPDTGISLQENEKDLIVRALAKTSGNQTHAAKLLNVTRDTLRYKMKKYQLN
ncbi:MAG: hypothetical protein A3F68_06970 [Acidobacteria bacterium RIFCSPLOWO2_12_FULL_54_10]|nr:MAG: hypothetical protein A3F68_06970 [Acidobacteria bacterium RIFCSPLOWO2_12_FULL_54_10]